MLNKAASTIAALREVRLITVIDIFGGRQEFLNTGQHKSAGGKEAATRIEFVDFPPHL
jgi:hypothetical protein